MKILAFIWVILMSIGALFIFVAVIVEKNIKEGTPFMKWWRKHVIGNAPDDYDL